MDEPIRARGNIYLIYGMTAAGAGELLGLRRICPREPARPTTFNPL